MTMQETSQARIAQLFERFKALEGAIETIFLGQHDVVEELLLTILAGGHALLEGAPGLGKTTLVRTLAQVLDLEFSRIQFTPDLMPADVIGMRILTESSTGKREFEFQRGPIFSNVVLADEINRATPRTQSALLEAMGEKQVTVFGETCVLDEPFMVIATQNPIEMEGTYPLPEAQLDRFLLKIQVESPPLENLITILDETTGKVREPVGPMVRGEELLEMLRLVREVPASSDMVSLAARLVRATHPSDESAPEGVRRFVRHGASPRGGQALLLSAKARALVQGRLHVQTQDFEALAKSALRHRLILNYEGEASAITTDELVLEALEVAKKA
ncbi:MAG TPA: MoxR family ATPase [Planctomycetes bacterium]|jgi:MoxR-like ATPase|nr:MoxR family ATPase [Planctomycetota bacterium]HIL52370.1 MoxR family ATPase [Planctomycetota bacterium]